MTIPKKINMVVWFFVLSVICFSLYFSGLRIQYYHDDFEVIFTSLSSNISYYFTHSNPYNYYRPIQASILALIQKYFGLETWPIHVLQLCIHILLSWLIFIAMIKLNFSTYQAIVASLFMMISQTNVLAVMSNDTLSQVSGTFFGCISVWFLYFFSFDNMKLRVRATKSPLYTYYILSVFTFIFSLLSKETSVSFIFLLYGIILLKNKGIKNRGPFIRKIIGEGSPYLIVIVLYLVVRSAIVGPQSIFSSGYYNLHLGMNIIKNLLQFLFAILIPLSSVNAYVVFKSGELTLFALIIIISLLFLAFIVYGLWNTKRYNIIFLFVVFSIINFFPVALMNHVSELYVYNSMPFISILVGAGLGQQLERNRARLLQHSLCAGLISVLFISHIIAIKGKITLMKDCGMRATVLFDNIKPYISKIPENGHLFLLNPSDNEIEYSSFLSKGFNVFEGGLHKIKELFGRADIMIKIISPADIQQIKCREDCLVLYLDGEYVRVYQHQ